ncbi:MAG TPA: hypothetical protein VF543_03605 [Pyrinomonadaceae bacterium]|jgi:WD40 repeat protein
MKRLIIISTFILLFQSVVRGDNPQLIIDNGGHLGVIRRMIFTHDGKQLISAGDDKVIRFWNLEKGTLERTIRGEIGEGTDGAIYALALSPDDKYLAVGGYMPESANQNVSVLENRMRSGIIRVYDLQTGEIACLLRGNTSVVNVLAFSTRDPNLLASGNASSQVMLWRISERRPELLYRHPFGFIHDISFSPDGQRLASAGHDGVLRIWDLRQKRAIKQERVQQELVAPHFAPFPLFAAVFSQTGNYLASAGTDGVIRLWDGTTGAFIKSLGDQFGKVNSLAFSGDNRLLTGPKEYEMRGPQLISVPDGEIINLFNRGKGVEEMTTAFSPDGKLAAIAGGGDFKIRLLRTDGQGLVREMGGPGRAIQSVAFSKDGRAIAFGETLDFKVANVRGPLAKLFMLNPGDNYGVSLRGDVRSQDGFIRARESYNNRTLQTKPVGEAQQGLLQVTRDDGKILREIRRDEADGYNHLSYTFTNDGRYIISGGENGVLLMYDAASGREIYEFKGHTGFVNSVAISPDNRTLISGSSDQTIRLWDIQAAINNGGNANLLSIFVGADDEWVAWTPQGYYTSSLNGDKYIGWHVNQGEDKAAKYYTAAQFQKQFYRPDVVFEYLKTRNIQVAARNANQKRRDIPVGQGVLSASYVSAVLPPAIKIESPQEEESTVDKEHVMLKATITSERLPITEVKVYLNGEMLNIYSVNSLKSVITGTVKLKPEENVLSIIAFNGQSYSEPVVRRITYRPAANRISPPSNLPRAENKPEAAPSYRLSPISYRNPSNSQQVLLELIEPAEPAERTDLVVQDPKLLVRGVAGSFTSPTTTVSIRCGEEFWEFNVGINPEGKKDRTFKTSINLTPGENTITVTASDQSASDSVTRKVFYNPKPPSDKKDLIFLGIGVNKSMDARLTELKFADRDVIEAARFFESQGALFNVMTKVIPDDEFRVPTRTAINAGLRWLQNKARENSNNINILYLSGHGDMDEFGSRYYFFSSEHRHPPLDDYDIRWSIIQDTLESLPGTTIIFIDTCRAGSAAQSTLKKLASPEMASKFIIFIASDQLGVSKENEAWEGGHGAFTAAVLLGLKGAADEVSNGGDGDKTVTLDELKRYIRKKVPEFVPGQVSDGQWLGGGKLDTLPLALTGRH